MIHLLFAQEDKSAVLSFFDKWGNAASVVGFCITLVGFVATFWSVWRVKRDVRDAVSRIATQLLSEETTALERHITAARQAGRDRNWPRAIDRCGQARLIAISLSRAPHLLKEEHDALKQACDELRLLAQYVENYRLEDGPEAENLPDKQKRLLDHNGDDGCGHSSAPKKRGNGGLKCTPTASVG